MQEKGGRNKKGQLRGFLVYFGLCEESDCCRCLGVIQFFFVESFQDFLSEFLGKMVDYR